MNGGGKKGPPFRISYLEPINSQELKIQSRL